MTLGPSAAGKTVSFFLHFPSSMVEYELLHDRAAIFLYLFIDMHTHIDEGFVFFGHTS
jgi:hypothetical protein